MFSPDTVQALDWDNLKYTVIDLETTVRNKGEDAVGKQTGSPHHPDNKVHLYGSTAVRTSPIPLRLYHKPYITVESYRYHRHHISRFVDALAHNIGRSDIIVGHNIKFDLLYLLKHHKEMIMAFLRKGGVIWDTMQAEYLLSNQQEQFAPLGDKHKVDSEGNSVLTRQGLATKYGGTDKDNRISEYWEAGVDTPDIPQEELEEYLHGDLENTARVFNNQMTLAQDNVLNLIQTQMQAIVATVFCEYNGMRFDIDRASDEAMRMAQQHDKLESELQLYMQTELNRHGDGASWVAPADCNPGSVKQLNTILFGGTFKYLYRVTVFDDAGTPVTYKSGARKGVLKTKKEEFVVTIDKNDALCKDYTSGLVSNKLGYVLDDSACKTLIKNMDGAFSYTPPSRFLKDILKYRKLSKDLNTYYMGLMKLTWPTDSCIHGSLHHCSTGTGRLSASNPNIQNIAGDDNE